MPGDIWWGDVIRARRALGDFPAAARALGYDVAAGTGSPAPAPDPLPAVPATPRPRPERPETPDPADTGGDTADEGEYANLPILQPVAREPLGPVVDADGDVLARTPPPGVRAAERRLRLLAPRSTAAILQLLLSRPVPDGAPDIAAALARIAAAEPVTDLPRTLAPTLRFGTQVLVDLGDSMQPFRRDQADVVDDVRAVIGARATEVVYFAEVPGRGAGPGRRWTWGPYRPPPPGTRVLLLSDFGIGADPLAPNRPTVREWDRLLRQLIHRGCQPIGLVPYPPARWPSVLLRHCPMITWDRHTTAGQARTAAP
ncbi:hypothetical protein [Actinoplanes subglobosus]|uniref:Uncharacterized protein n=1 Tax=Actinoplanes subglobosus TaxID=1547892 RepID=A0ABV8J8U5_9ACTN